MRAYPLQAEPLVIKTLVGETDFPKPQSFVFQFSRGQEAEISYSVIQSDVDKWFANVDRITDQEVTVCKA